MAAADQSAHKMPQTIRGIVHRTVFHNRWMNLVASFFIMSCAGALYSFGLYSQKLKTTLGYNQETISTIGLFKDLGANIGIVAGILYDSVGSWLVLLLAAIFNILGYMMAWAAITGKIAKPQVWQMCTYLWIGASSGAFASTAVIVSCVKNFPRNRGIVIGLLKGFVGLSGAMLTQIYRALYGEDPSSFILVVAWFPCFVFLLFMFVVRPIDRQEGEDDGADYEMRNFYVFLAMALLLAVFLMVVILVQHLVEVPKRVNQVLMGVMVLILALPVYVVVESEWRSRAKAIGSSNQAVDAKEEDPSQLNPASEEPPAAEACIANKMPPSNDRPELAAVHETQKPRHEHHGVQLDAAVDHSNSESSHNGFAADAQIRNSIQQMPRSNFSPTGSIQQESSASQACTKTEKPPKQHSSLDPESLNSGSTRSELRRRPNIVRRLIVDRVVRELKQMPQRGEDHTVIQALASLDLWIVFIATTAGLGSGLMAIDNLGQMGASMGYSQSNISTFVSLLSIWNFFGRVGFGFLSELMLQKWGSPRPLFLAVVLGLLAVGHLYVAFALKGALYIGSVLIGLCFGAQMPIMFAIISEIFGLAYFGTLYNVGILASPLGTYLLSVKTAGHLYDLQARKQQEEQAQQQGRRDLLCYGSICYRNSLFIMAAVCVFGCIISALLAYRTKQYYKSVRARGSHG